MPDTTEGGCFCGQVRYRVAGKPANSMICHCQSCRRVAAAPVVPWVTFPKERFAIVKGKPASFRSSDPVRRTFCAECGTPVTYEHAERPDDIDVTTCSLDDPNLFPPTHHSWMSHDVAWIRFDDGRPMFPESRPA